MVCHRDAFLPCQARQETSIWGNTSSLRAQAATWSQPGSEKKAVFVRHLGRNLPLVAELQLALPHYSSQARPLAGKPSCHKLKKCRARQVVLARRIRPNPAGKFGHGLAAFGRGAWDANLCSILTLLIRLKHSLSEPIAEVQSGEVGSVGGLDRTGISEVAGRPDVNGNWSRFRRGGWRGGACHQVIRRAISATGMTCAVESAKITSVA